jgi:thiamine kinase-like enzyme
VDNKNITEESIEEAAARRRLEALPGFSRETARAARLTRLLGFTNCVYRVDVDGKSVCLRIPGDGAAAKIDRRAEEVNARLAAKAGVAPEVLHFGEDGVMLTRFVEGGLPLRPERIQASEGPLTRGAAALRQLHDSDATFASTFRVFETIDVYVAALQRLGRPPSGAEQNAINAAQAIRDVLEAHPVPPKPCHCDPTGRNMLDTDERVWLVDWEYSGMNDPMWDLAYFSIESLLDEAGDAALLTAYFGHAPEQKLAARMAVLKPVAEVMAALWALIQISEGKTGGDFAGYAKGTFKRAAERMEAAVFAKHMEALHAG